MSIDVGAISMTGTIHERTWRTSELTPVEGEADPLNNYLIEVLRELIVRDSNGVVVQKIRSHEEAVTYGASVGLDLSWFQGKYVFTAGQAVAIKATIMTDIVTTLEQLISDVKNAESPE